MPHNRVIAVQRPTPLIPPILSATKDESSRTLLYVGHVKHSIGRSLLFLTRRERRVSESEKNFVFPLYHVVVQWHVVMSLRANLSGVKLCTKLSLGRSNSAVLCVCVCVCVMCEKMKITIYKYHEFIQHF